MSGAAKDTPRDPLWEELLEIEQLKPRRVGSFIRDAVERARIDADRRRGPWSEGEPVEMHTRLRLPDRLPEVDDMLDDINEAGFGKATARLECAVFNMWLSIQSGKFKATCAPQVTVDEFVKKYYENSPLERAIRAENYDDEG